MKKMIAIFLLLMYSLSVSGSVVQLHFCGNNYKSFSVNSNDKKPCCCPVKKEAKSEIGIKDKKSCCSQTDIAFKIDIDQSNNNGLPQLQFLQAAILVEATVKPVFSFENSVSFDVLNYPANAPPDGNWQQIPLYKLFNSLVYYG